jgi:hypothetical protein
MVESEIDKISDTIDDILFLIVELDLEIGGE